jgi:predicted 3-demethylubiquinone-9 3-methyltransferase (glyoxalase superfamily)
MQKITPFLWFNDNAEEAVNFYISVFKNSKIKSITRWGDAGPGPKGSVLTIDFELNGNSFIALNGGPQFAFTEAVSFVVDAPTQEDIDYYWEKLTADGGEESMCGWLKDRFGLSWQIVPPALLEMINKGNKKSDKAMEAMMTMRKLDIATLKAAYDNA